MRIQNEEKVNCGGSVFKELDNICKSVWSGDRELTHPENDILRTGKEHMNRFFL